MSRVFFLFLAVVLVVAHALKSLEGIELLGRFAVKGGQYAANWPGTGVRFHVLQPPGPADTIITMTFTDCQDSCKYVVGVFVDHVALMKVEINASNHVVSFTLPASTSSATKLIEFRKVTEVSQGDASGVMYLGELEVRGGEVVVEKDGKARKLLVFGDSVTCGYGVDGKDPCSFSAATEDTTHAYAYLVSRAVEADIDIVAWSGKGVVRNYGDVSPVSDLPLPGYYNRTLAHLPATSIEDNYWVPKRYVPDVVIVALGTNDYSTSPQPSDDQFIEGYVNFVHQIQHDYPSAKLLSLCEPMYNGNQCQNIQKAAGMTGVEYFAVPSSTVVGWGCSGHPDYPSQQNAADLITPVVQKMMQW